MQNTTNLFTIAKDEECLDYLAMHNVKIQNVLRQILEKRAKLGEYSEELEQIYLSSSEARRLELAHALYRDECLARKYETAHTFQMRTEFQTVQQIEEVRMLENAFADGVPVEIVDTALLPENAFFPFDSGVQGLGHGIQSGVAKMPLVVESVVAFLGL